MIIKLIPEIAFAAADSDLRDALPAKYVPAAMFVVILILALSISFLGKTQARAQRSLALLIVLIASLGIFSQLLPMALGTGISLAIFLGTFVVIFLLGRFDSPN
jgi:hypothetical protein